MAWTSSYLGSNVVSSYLHIDNLRTDIITGKSWDATSGVDYIQTYHDGTDGQILTNTGDIKFTAAGGDYRFYNASGTAYCAVTPIAAYTTLSTSAGYLVLSPTNGQVVMFTTGVDSEFVMYASGGVDTVSLGAGLAAGDLQYGLRSAYSGGPLQIVHTANTGRIQFAGLSTSGVCRLELWDRTSNAWYKIYVSGGTLVTAAV